jgi:hypothetical protein
MTLRTKAWSIALAAALALYLATMAPGLLWGDGGETQLHVFLGDWHVSDGIARSHVLYFALARGIRWGFNLEAARAANLLAACAGALTVANVAWILAALCRCRVAVAGGTLLLLTSHTLWQLSASADVITLTTALLTAEFMALAKWTESSQVRWLAVLAVLNGLGVSNHNLSLLMWPVYFFVFIRIQRHGRQSFFRPALAIFLSFLLGALPVLLLCFDEWRRSGSLADTARSFLMGQYGSQVLNVSNGPGLIGRSLLIAALNFPTPLLIAGIPGLLRCRVVAKPALAWGMIGGTLVFAAFGIRYDVPDQQVFLAPLFVCWAVMIGIGLDALLNGVSEHVPSRAPGDPTRTAIGRNRRSLVILLFSVASPLVYAAVPPLYRRFGPDAGLLPIRSIPYRDRLDWFIRPWRVSDHGAERFARETLDRLPPNAWLVVDSTLCMPLNYLQAVVSLRKDVRLDSRLARQPWRQEGDIVELRERKLAEGLLFAGANDPSHLPEWLREPHYQFEPFGHVFRVWRRP